MSYDIYFKARNSTNFPTLNVHVASITWYLREMIVRSTGLEWKNKGNNGLVKDVIPHIRKGLAELIKHPEKYKQYEDPKCWYFSDGWGTIKQCKRFFCEIIITWDHLNPEVKETATFWIE